VPGATVRVAGSDRSTSTNDDGTFAFQVAELTDPVLEVTAPGYIAARVENLDPPLAIVLSPLRINQTMTVTAARAPTSLDETPASVIVLDEIELRNTAAVTLDDVLRQVPGFTLFRRTGSRVANPTTQGVSLRGVGASGAGRTVVLDDGIPLNDPFGGWVYWGRVPREALGQIEVLRGGGSHLYGSSALGGVVHLVRRKPDDALISIQGSHGSNATTELSLFLGSGGERWRMSGAAEALRTDGYIVISESERGAVDVPADSERVALDLTLERNWLADRARLFARASRFDEERGNGTRLQSNETEIEALSLGGDFLARSTHYGVRLYGSRQDYLQSFSAISAGRSQESLTRLQRVPSEATGASFQAVSEIGASHRIVGGFDLRSVRGRSDERGFGFAETFSSSGGRQTSTGVFLEDSIRLSNRFSIMAALRFDQWHNGDATRTESGESLPLESRREEALSPRIAAQYRINDHWTIVSSAYQAFRAPTLNELYRGFRVGNVVTNANEDLEAETLTGLEAGIVMTSLYQRARVRAMWFRADVDDPIANVTQSITPSLITRQRQNLGRTRSEGLEVEGELRPDSRWSVTAGLLHVMTEVTSSPGSEELVGLSLPQMPENQATVQVQYASDVFVTALQGRWSDQQFDDDRNLFPLESYLALDALLSRSVGRGIELVLAGENLTGERYETGRTPVTTIGPPRSFRLGLRARWPAR
jgi:outer membrane receptor protein involved in Fe transport